MNKSLPLLPLTLALVISVSTNAEQTQQKTHTAEQNLQIVHKTQQNPKTAHKAELEKSRQAAYNIRYPTIIYPQLKKAMDAQQVFIIDANSAEMFEKGHLPGAYSLADLQALEQHLPVLKTYPIVVYCGGPQCTAWYWAADFMTAKGYTNIMHYKEGNKGWTAANQRLSIPK